MSSDGKVIVYEENFGIWKLDVASGQDERDQARHRHRREGERGRRRDGHATKSTAFDISPSGRRAVISARGQILTIATDRGDITRIAPDKMASRNQSPKWSPDGKYIAFISDRSGRDEIWITDPEGRTPKKITDLDNEKGALVWTPDSKALLYTAADKKLYSYTRRRRQDGGRRVERRRPHRLGRRSRPTASGSRSRSRTARCARTSTSRRSPAAKSGTSPTTACSTPRTTPSGPPTAATSSSRRPRAPATASRRRAASTRRWRCGRCRCAIRIAIR